MARLRSRPAVAALLGGICICDAEDFDYRCWRWAAEAAASGREGCDPENPCRSDCWSSIFTHSYCCVENSPCWWWGHTVSGDVVKVDAARSGVECRHICQAEPLCTVWTFQMPKGGSVDADPEAAGPCTLKLSKAGRATESAADGVVSGARLCAATDAADPPPLVSPAPLSTLVEAEAASHVFKPEIDADYAVKAARSLLEDGWAVIRGALAPSAAHALEVAAASAAEALLERDPAHIGNRGPRRYSFGGSSLTHHMVHVKAWADLLDNEVVKPVLAQAFGGEYVAVGGGGDFVLGTTDTHQRLHVDLQQPEMYDVEFPPAAIAANFAVSDVGCTDGPMRIVPSTQRLPLMVAEEASRGAELAHASSLEKEIAMQARLKLRAHMICPMSPGDVLLRDMRLWHGGTPNHGSAIRLLPSAEFLAPWYADLTSGTEDHFAPRPALPFSHWWQMSDHGKKVARRIVSAPLPVNSGTRQDFVLLLPYVAEDRP